MALDEAIVMTHPAFTPSALDADELDATTVGRTTTFETLVNRIKGAARDGSRPHTLLVAPRGAGKTHTVHVAVHRSIADPVTAKSVLPVFIPEDSLAIGSYLDLLIEIARSIDERLAVSARAMRLSKDAIGIEQAIITAASGRMIMLVIENLDRVFESLGPRGQGALRAWVETSTAVMIFATAPTLFAGVSSRSYPWYGSFIVESLPELTVDDAGVMLGTAARRNSDEPLAHFIESAQGRQRLQVIHRLAGGSPRLWRMLSEGIDIESLDALVPAVESLLDRLAPYYQQQLWQLPTGEQRLVVELARGWQRRTVTDLAGALGISNQSAAAALGRLTASRWVASTKASTGDQRSSWYDLTEPLLRYHLQYREDRGKPLRLIVEFLRGFYSRQRLLDELAEAVPDSPVERHLQHAWTLKHDGKPDEALAAVDDILDDIDGSDRITELDRNATWALWLSTIPAAKLPRQRVGSVDAGWAMAMSLRRGDVQPEQFDTVMAAFTEDTRSAVAASVAMATPALALEMPAEHDPLRYVDDELLAPIARYIAEQAKELAQQSDS